MKYILFFISLLLPYLASAQVAKDTVTVLTIAQIPAGEIRDTTNITFVQDNAFRKATFDSLAKYTRVKLIGDRGDITVSGATGLTWELDAGVVDSMQLSAGAVVLPGAKVTGTLPVSKGGTGNQTGLAATATALATGRTIQTNLASTSSATFDGTANITPGITGTLGGANGGTGLTSFGAIHRIPFAASTTTLTTDTGFVYNTSTQSLGIGTSNPSRRLYVINNTAGGVSMTLQSNILRSDATSSYAFQLKSEGRTGSSYAFRALNLEETKIYMTIQTDSLNQVGGDRTGFVGIGTDAPTQVLHVVGNARISGLGGVGTADVQADANGVLVRASSLELKENIEQLPYGLHEVMQLYPVRFNYKNREKWGDGKDIGFIAEDVLQVTSEAVGISSEGELYLNNSRIIPTLVKAIQQQQQQIEELKMRITQLEINNR